MSFLYPFFLFLLPLALLPLLLFLGLKGKKREILFSTLFLLRKKDFKEERVKQKYRLWLIIILRILMLTTIILLMARPRYFGKRWHNAYFDASISMKAGDGKVKKSLFKLFEIFGESRVKIVSSSKGRLFVDDTSIVPKIGENDVFYTDGKLPYLPNGKIICSPYWEKDAWIFQDSVKGDTIYLRANVPIDANVKVYTPLGIKDSLSLSMGENKFIYILSGNEKYWWFFVDYKDDFMDNNFYFYTDSDKRIPVKLTKTTRVLKAFFTSVPFVIQDHSDNCVTIDTVLPDCKKQLVFYGKKHDADFYLQSATKVRFGKWAGYRVNSGNTVLLILDFYPYDTASQFYDPLFLESLADTLKSIFRNRKPGKRLFLRELDFKNCTGPILSWYDVNSGFYVCNDDTVAVNVDPVEYTTPSLCDRARKVSFRELSSITLVKRLLIYFLVILFIVETTLVYVL